MNRAKRDKAQKVLKRGAHTHLLPKEIKTTPQIICMTCGKPSGWTNEDLRFITKSRDLKCTVCKKTCAIIKVNEEQEEKKEEEEMKHPRIFLAGEKETRDPLHQRNYDNFYS